MWIRGQCTTARFESIRTTISAYGSAPRNMFTSEDGGKTWVQNVVTRIHGDYHGLWIDPANSNHMLAGSDGGIHQSYDRGRSWDYINTIPLGQFYEISLDNQKALHGLRRASGQRELGRAERHAQRRRHHQ